MTKTVALFGGSFNPPHVAHAMAATYVLMTQDVDELWFMPAYNHAFGKDLISYTDRVKMCSLVASEFPRARISLAEKQAQRWYNPEGVHIPSNTTYNTLCYLRRKNTDIEYRLVVGTDILGETHKWFRWDEVERMAPPIVVPRGGEYGIPNISSTLVRDVVAKGINTPWLPRKVSDYITKNKLYV